MKTLATNALSTTATALALVALSANAALAGQDRQDAQPAKQESARGDGCVFSRNITDWQVVDNHTVVVWAPTRKTPYVVELFAPASGLKFEHTLGFEDRNSDGRFCDYGGDSIVIGGPVPERVSVSKVRRVDEQEVKLLLAQAQKPKAKASAALPEQSDMKSDKAKDDGEKAGDKAEDGADKDAPEKPR